LDVSENWGIHNSTDRDEPLGWVVGFSHHFLTTKIVDESMGKEHHRLRTSRPCRSSASKIAQKNSKKITSGTSVSYNLYEKNPKKTEK
jgi:hypothetical protein